MKKRTRCRGLLAVVWAAAVMATVAGTADVDGPQPNASPLEGGTVDVDFIKLNVAGFVGNIQWQASRNGSTFTNLLDATGFVLDVTDLYVDTPWFRVKATSGGNAPAYSAAMQVREGASGTVFCVF
jgi:hypothetical protein